jgi:hypothetical protein
MILMILTLGKPHTHGNFSTAASASIKPRNGSECQLQAKRVLSLAEDENDDELDLRFNLDLYLTLLQADGGQSHFPPALKRRHFITQRSVS